MIGLYIECDIASQWKANQMYGNSSQVSSGPISFKTIRNKLFKLNTMEIKAHLTMNILKGSLKEIGNSKMLLKQDDQYQKSSIYQQIMKQKTTVTIILIIWNGIILFKIIKKNYATNKQITKQYLVRNVFLSFWKAIWVGGNPSLSSCLCLKYIITVLRVGMEHGLVDKSVTLVTNWKFQKLTTVQ